MKISIVVPSFNQAAYLRATLESILSQADRDTEVLVFDGGSKDGSVRILREFEDRIFWVSERDHGQSDAINKGLRRAGGDVLAYLNSDDVYLPGALETVRRHFRDHPDSRAAYGRAQHLKASGRFLSDYPTEPWNYERLQETCFICQPACFWRRATMERFGVLDPALQYAMDYEYWLRLGRSFAFDYLDAAPPLAGSRLHDETKTLSARVPVHREILAVVQRHATTSAGVRGWLRHLAYYRAIEQVPNPRTAERRRAYVTRWSANLLLYAEEFGIPLDETILAELDSALTGIEK
jgi:glycosyltransferase involved in cell wall biosynthesis